MAYVLMICEYMWIIIVFNLNGFDRYPIILETLLDYVKLYQIIEVN